MTEERFYTVQQAADLLAIHKQSVYRLVWARRLGWTNVGTAGKPRIRISAEAIRQYRLANERVAGAA